jgi:uncharacterized RDD family membrane protein YckC
MRTFDGRLEHSADHTAAGPRRVATEGIVTPEAIVLELETAGVASRVLAGLIDLLVQVGLLFVGLVLMALFRVTFGIDSESATLTAAAILVAGVMLGYPVLLETIGRGRTIGKRALGLRAVTVEGTPITFRHATLRTMGGLVDRYLPPGGITGALFVLGTRRRQRIGDLLAGTVVIRDPERTALPRAIWFPVPHGYEAYAATIDPTPITSDQYTLIRAFVLRARELTVDARFSIAEHLADRTAAHVGHVRPRQVHPETFLLCALARYQRRNFPSYQPAAWQGR